MNQLRSAAKTFSISHENPVASPASPPVTEKRTEAAESDGDVTPANPLRMGAGESSTFRSPRNPWLRSRPPLDRSLEQSIPQPPRSDDQAAAGPVSRSIARPSVLPLAPPVVADGASVASYESQNPLRAP